MCSLSLLFHVVAQSLHPLYNASLYRTGVMIMTGQHTELAFMTSKVFAFQNTIYLTITANIT